MQFFDSWARNGVIDKMEGRRTSLRKPLVASMTESAKVRVALHSERVLPVRALPHAERRDD